MSQDEITRCEFRFDKETMEKIDVIRSAGVKSKAEAVRLAIYHLAEHVQYKELLVNKK